jgi:hypothetical protein
LRIICKKKEENIEDQNKASKNKLWIIVITVVLTAIVVGGAFYGWSKYSQGKKELENFQTNSNQLTPPEQDIIDESPEVIQSPSEVIDGYLKSTIGTIEGGNVDDNKAKSYLTDSLKAQFTDSNFPKKTYGIVNQNWPHDVKIDTENAISDTKVIFTISGDWSSAGTPSNFEKFCDITTMLSGNTFKISEIKSHLLDDEFRIPEGF